MRERWTRTDLAIEAWLKSMNGGSESGVTWLDPIVLFRELVLFLCYSTNIIVIVQYAHPIAVTTAVEFFSPCGIPNKDQASAIHNGAVTNMP